MYLLDPRWSEEAVYHDGVGEVLSIPESLLAPAKSSRTLVTEKTGSGMISVLAKKGKFVLSRDTRCKVEFCSLTQQLDETSAEVHADTVLRCLGYARGRPI